MGPRARRRVRAGPRAAGGGLAARRGGLRGRDLVPGRPPGHRRGGRRRGPGGRGPRARCWRAAASCSRSAEVFDLYRGEQVGEGRKSLALRLTFRAADRTLTDEEVAERRSAIRPPSLERIGGPLRELAGILVAGASGYAGALAAELVGLHPSLELAGVTARSDAGKRLNELYPQYRSPLMLEELDLDDGRRRSTPRSSPTRTAPRLRSWRRCAASGPRSSTSRPTSACATCPPTSAGTGSTARQSCSTSAVYGLTELHREADRRGRAGREPRLLSDRDACWPWPRWPRRA